MWHQMAPPLVTLSEIEGQLSDLNDLKSHNSKNIAHIIHIGRICFADE